MRMGYRKEWGVVVAGLPSELATVKENDMEMHL